MKKLFILFIAIFTLSTNLNVVHAQISDNQPEIILLENGDYLEIFTTENNPLSLMATTLSSSTKSAQRTINHKDNSGKLLWTATLKASFTYNKSTSKCTSSNISSKMIDTKWKSTTSSSKNNNTAIGNITAKEYINGSVHRKVSKKLTLSCDKNGKITA